MLKQAVWTRLRLVMMAVLCAGIGCDQGSSAGQPGSEAAAGQQPSKPGETPPAPGPGRTTPSGKPMPALGKGALGPPPIVFEPPILDFGQVRPNQRVNGTIYVRNTGDAPVKILSTKPDCSCTSINLSNVVLGPGERVAMQPAFQSGNMGEKLSGVKVAVENYDEVLVNLKALVTLPVSADPPYASAIPDENGVVTPKGEYTLKSLDGRPFRVLAVNSGPPPYLDFDPDKDELRNNYRLGWDLTSYQSASCLDASGRRMPGWIVIETDHSECPVLDIEVRHACTARARPTKENPWTWIISEKRYLLGKMAEGQAQEIEIVAKWLPAAQQAPDPITAAVSESSQFTAELVSVERVSDGMVSKVRVTPAAGHHGLVYGTLRMKSARHSAPIVIIGSVQ